jgi:hypothetical protein
MDSTARRLAALFVVGVLLWFSPLAGTFSRPTAVFGLPLFPVYLFGVWAALVVVARYLVGGGRR